jgi:hypothetical protein
MLRLALIAFAGLSLTACAFGDAKLKVAYDPAAAKAGVLSEAPSATIDLKDVEDARVEKPQIGYKRNGFGMKTADIFSERPAPEIVKEALAATLEKNGHKTGDSRYAVTTKLNKFWFDYKTGLVTVEFYGSVQAEISVVDQQTGTAIYTETFDGYHSRKQGGGLSKTWTLVMNEALADLVNKVNLSPAFKDALSQTGAPAPAPVSAAPADPALLGS